MGRTAMREGRGGRTRKLGCVPLLLALTLAACPGSGSTGPAVAPAGKPPSTRTDVLAAGARTMPLGDPQLAWSSNRFGEIDPALVEDRDRRIDTDAIQDRQDLVPLAYPQMGVDALKGAFGRPTRPIPGIVDQASAAR